MTATVVDFARARRERELRDAHGGKNRIRQLRGLRALTLRDVADQLGVSPEDVAAWEAHEVPVPDRHAGALSAMFRMSADFVFGEEEA